jgi:trehalose 6-phosphate phosphatase
MDHVPHLPSPPPLGEIAEPALFLDFDGTLVAIAATPDAIHVPGDLAERLGALGERLDGRLALVSGRATEDLADHLGSLPFARAGSHGMERFTADGEELGSPPQPIPDEARAALQAFAEHPGILYEAKPLGGALHYRAAPELAHEANHLAEAIAKRHGLSVKLGKCVTELVRPGADKGAAVRAFMADGDFAGALPVFVGDDLTDEDGFAVAADMGGFGVLVGESRPTAARYRLATVNDVHHWLAL